MALGSPPPIEPAFCASGAISTLLPGDLALVGVRLRVVFLAHWELTTVVIVTLVVVCVVAVGRLGLTVTGGSSIPLVKGVLSAVTITMALLVGQCRRRRAVMRLD
jgi:hypothetical protein